MDDSNSHHKTSLSEKLDKAKILTKVLNTSLKKKKDLIYSQNASLRTFLAVENMCKVTAKELDALVKEVTMLKQETSKKR